MIVKAFCAPDAVQIGDAGVHDAYMAKKGAKKVVSRLEPLYQRTFIKPWREYREMTQDELANKVSEYLSERGIKESYTYASIGRLERGKLPYRQPVMEGIAWALEVTVETLIAHPPPKTPGQPDPDGEIRSILGRANDDERERYLDILKTITRKAGAN